MLSIASAPVLTELPLIKSVEMLFQVAMEMKLYPLTSVIISFADDFEEKKPSIKKGSKAPARKKKDCDTEVSNSAKTSKPSKREEAKSQIKESKKNARNKENCIKEETCR